MRWLPAAVALTVFVAWLPLGPPALRQERSVLIWLAWGLVAAFLGTSVVALAVSGEWRLFA